MKTPFRARPLSLGPHNAGLWGGNPVQLLESKLAAGGGQEGEGWLGCLRREGLCQVSAPNDTPWQGAKALETAVGDRAAGVGVRMTARRGRTREPRGARRALWPEAGGGRGAGAAGEEGALGEPPEPRGAQASSAIHSCTGARAELLIGAIVTRGRCGSRASTLARDKWPLTAPPRQESSLDFTARRLSGLCLARFPVRTFKSASQPSLLPDAAPPSPSCSGPGRAPSALRAVSGPLPIWRGPRWGALGAAGGDGWRPPPRLLTSSGAEPRAPPPRPQDGSGYRAESGL